jgi:Ca2+-binding RTX toxin-like protein
MNGRTGRLVRRFSLASLAAVIVALMVGPSTASAQTVVSCPFAGSSGDQVSRGFYVTNYPGTNIDKVTLAYDTSTAGTYAITVTARAGTYDGPIIGTSAASVSLPAGTTPSVPVSFAFGGVLATQGSTITFSQSATGPGTLFYDVGVGPCPGVTQTNGTTPPLDTTRRDSVGLTITQAPPGAAGAGVVTCKGQRVTQVGSNGNDQLVGTANRDVIAALDGRDEVSGLAGGDIICGGKGKDTLKGGKGRDKLLGQKGKDRLKGGGARDLCKGGKGNDSASACEVEKSI